HFVHPRRDGDADPFRHPTGPVPDPHCRAEGGRRMNRLIAIGLTLGVVAIFGIYLAGAAARPDRANKDGFDFETMRRLPVLEGGRVKPLDTVARSTLRVLRFSEVYED